MPRVDEDLAPDLDRLTQSVDKDLQDALRFQSDQLQTDYQRLSEELGRQPGLDPQQVDSLRGQLDRQLEALRDFTKELDTQGLSRELASQLDEALRNDRDLDEVVQQLERSAEEVRPAAERALDTDLTDEARHEQILDRDEARENLASIERAREVAEIGQEMRDAAREVEAIREQLRTAGTVEQNMRELQHALDEAEEAAQDRVRRLRISQEMTDGEIEF